ncbi:hypothetical protein F4779DRAFT_615034 [Xylariaceae sp. FL0662B]|nr:hypothetical protein F4779DRAFT_615034 [Xylariaceae sp. FL0662B]
MARLATTATLFGASTLAAVLLPSVIDPLRSLPSILPVPLPTFREPAPAGLRGHVAAQSESGRRAFPASPDPLLGRLWLVNTKPSVNPAKGEFLDHSRIGASFNRRAVPCGARYRRTGAREDVLKPADRNAKQGCWRPRRGAPTVSASRMITVRLKLDRAITSVSDVFEPGFPVSAVLQIRKSPDTYEISKIIEDRDGEVLPANTAVIHGATIGSCS